MELKESKEKLPIAFITSFVSDGWEKVGILKEEIEAIKKEFSETKEVEDLIQALIDAYLVCIGQMEQHLADKKGIELPAAEEVKESLKEDVTINIEHVEITEPEIKVKNKEIDGCCDDSSCEELPAEQIAVEMTEPETDIEEPTISESGSEEISDIERLEEIEEACKHYDKDDSDKFEYFVDEFPEPVKETNID